MGWTTKEFLNSVQGQGIYLLSKMPRLAPGPTEPCSVSIGVPFIGVKYLGHEAAHMSL